MRLKNRIALQKRNEKKTEKIMLEKLLDKTNLTEVENLRIENFIFILDEFYKHPLKMEIIYRAATLRVKTC